MKHLYLKCLLLGILSLLGIKAEAYDCYVNRIYYNLDNTNNTASVTYIYSYYTSLNETAYSGSVTIPSSITYNGITYSVTSIGDYAFNHCYDLTSVTIPNSVTSIGMTPFYCCINLTSILVASDNSVYDSRNNCNAIIHTASNTLIAGCKNTKIPYSVTSIGNYAFWNCNLTSVIIPSSVIRIEDYAFFYSGLKSVTIPNSLTSIGKCAFYGCNGLTSVEIPSSVTNIESGAFGHCTGLTSVNIGKSVTSIGEDAFSDCNNLITVTINSNAILSKPYIYKIFGSQVTEYVLGEGVTSIGDYAFFCCGSMTSIDIPSSVTSIGDNAFSGCSELTSVEIPSSVTSIKDRAFINCYNLATVTINSNAILSKPYSSSSNINNKFGSQVTKYVLGEGVTSIGDYAFCGCGRLTSVVIPSSVTSINGYAFYGCSGLTSIEIPSSVTSIGENAFNGCIGLKKVIARDMTAWCKIAFADSWSNPLYYAHHLFSDENTEINELVIPNNVTNIGDYTFSGCSGLTSVVIPSSVTSIGNYTFQSCSGLTSVSIPSSVTSIGYYAFSGCSNLTSVVIPSSVTSIGAATFCRCSGLTSIVIPSSVTSIGYQTFSGCSGLTSVVIPSSVTSIGSSAFEGCCGLTSVEIPSGVTSIGRSAFSGCSGLTSIVIPSSVTSIGSSVFFGCSGLISVSIPNSVTSIENYTFKGCSGLTSVEIPSSVTSIGDYAFDGCSGLISVSIPNSVTSIGSYAFQNCNNVYDIYSEIKDVFVTGTDAFKGCENATLHVPVGTYVAYSGRADWNRIIHIVENSDGFKMAMACNTRGSVLVNDETVITNKIAEVEIKDNEENSFVFIPRENCKLDEVTLNGVDLISLVENNKLKAVIPDNSQMNVVFSKYANLTVKQGTTGYTRQAVKADTRHTIYIGSLGENKVNTVIFNGVDVTDELVNGYYTTPEIKGESVLSISFETNLSVKSMSLNELKVMGYNGEIQIKNIDEPSDVFVYTVDGKLVGNVPSAYGSASIQVASEELYVVKVGSRVFKVAL